MLVLIACETSGVLRRAFARRGHDAVSCDLLPAEDGSDDHIVGDAIAAIRSEEWDLVVAHPPCTYLSSSGLHWNNRVPGREAKTNAALQFVERMANALDAHASSWAIENPQGRISTAWRKPDQYIQPYEFGDDASKKTGLWLCDLPLLVPTRYVAPRMVNGKPRWANQTDSGQNRLGPSPTRWKDRSRTYRGIADAMARQWGGA